MFHKLPTNWLSDTGAPVKSNIQGRKQQETGPWCHRKYPSLILGNINLLHLKLLWRPVSVPYPLRCGYQNLGFASGCMLHCWALAFCHSVEWVACCFLVSSMFPWLMSTLKILVPSFHKKYFPFSGEKCQIDLKIFFLKFLCSPFFQPVCDF